MRPVPKITVKQLPTNQRISTQQPTTGIRSQTFRPTLLRLRQKNQDLGETIDNILNLTGQVTEVPVPNQPLIPKPLLNTMFFKPLKDNISCLSNNMGYYLKQYTAVASLPPDFPELKKHFTTLLHLTAEIFFDFLQCIKEQLAENIREHRWLTLACFVAGAFISCYYIASPGTMLSGMVQKIYQLLNVEPVLIEGVVAVLTGATAAALLPNTLHLIATLIEQMTNYFNNLLQNKEKSSENIGSHPELFADLIKLLKPQIESTIHNGVEVSANHSSNEEDNNENFGPSMYLSNNNNGK